MNKYRKRKSSRSKKKERKIENDKYNRKSNLRNLQQNSNIHTSVTGNNSTVISTTGIIHIGKYKGRRLKDISDLGYLKWMEETFTLNSYSKNLLSDQINTIADKE